MSSYVSFTERYTSLCGIAEEWVDALPRERLGAFAIEREMLVAEKVYRMWLQDFPSDQGGLVALMDKIDWITRCVLGENATSHAKTIYTNRSNVETRFWLAYTGETSGNGSDVLDDSNFTFVIFDNPPMLPYFEAGFRNKRFIQRFIDSGVDAELAWRLHEEELNNLLV